MFEPIFHGSPIEVRYSSGLRDEAGNEAYAATYIRRRLILLDEELRRHARVRKRILLHEIFHFAWTRLGNTRRRDWEAFLAAEIQKGARGEAGWSAEWRKRALQAAHSGTRSRRWREYCCESFCDTGALIGGGGSRETTLALKWRRLRQRWFQTQFGGRPIAV
jgi:hypothetical protein